MRGVRLFGRLYPAADDKPITGIRLRVLARTTPADATIDVMDVQLQPGDHITGWAPHTRDLGVAPVEGWQWRNGVVYGDQTLIVIADAPAASPTRWEITRANGNCRIGDYHLGHTTTAVVDGHAHTATQGAGLPPHLTARADIDIDLHLEGRAALSCWFRGLTAADPSEPPPDDLDPIDPDAPWPDPDEDDDVEEPPEPPPPDDDEDNPEDP